jgi:hypothetical protein
MTADRAPRTPTWVKYTVLALVLAGGAAVTIEAVFPALAARFTAPSRTAPEPVEFSNTLPGDYVGPESCQTCHQQIYDSWSKHPHSVMNQWATPKTVKADFSDQSIAFLGGTAHFAREGDRYTMSLKRGKTERKYTVLRTVGSRFTQFFIGKQIEGPEPKDHVLYTTEQRLPFAYWFRAKRWLPESYFDPWGPDLHSNGAAKRDPYDKPDPLSYNQNCMVCHTTYPYLYRLGNYRVRRGFPPDDLVFDDNAVWGEWKKTVPLGELYDDKLSRQLDPNKHLVRMGISCESCHFGGRVHVKEETTVAMFPVSNSPSIRVAPPTEAQGRESWKNQYLVNGICRQCHSAKGDTYPNGAAVGNSREALDLAAGECSSQMSCTNCHNPHESIGLKPPDPNPVHIQACVGCHDKYDSPEVVQAHGAHPREANVTCMDCHMPRIAQGIDEIVRSHRVSSPTDTKMIAAASVNACNLCHLDQSIQWTVDALKERWNVSIALKPEWRLQYRGFDTPLGPLWLMSKEHAERKAATAAYVRSPLGKKSLPLLMGQLNDVAPANRMFALFGIQKLLGCELRLEQYDPTLPPPQRQKQINALASSLDSLCAKDGEAEGK